VEKAVSVQNMEQSAISGKLQELVKHGETLPRFVVERGSPSCVRQQAQQQAPARAELMLLRSDGSRGPSWPAAAAGGRGAPGSCRQSSTG
jgi:hypothetical protein